MDDIGQVKTLPQKSLNFLLVQQLFDKLLLNTFREEFYCFVVLYPRLSFIILALVIFLREVAKTSVWGDVKKLFMQEKSCICVCTQHILYCGDWCVYFAKSQASSSLLFPVIKTSHQLLTHKNDCSWCHSLRQSTLLNCSFKSFNKYIKNSKEHMYILLIH